MEISANFEKKIAEIDRPECFGRFLKDSAVNKMTCGFCCYVHKCKAEKPAKPAPVKGEPVEISEAPKPKKSKKKKDDK